MCMCMFASVRHVCLRVRACGCVCGTQAEQWSPYGSPSPPATPPGVYGRVRARVYDRVYGRVRVWVVWPCACAYDRVRVPITNPLLPSSRPGPPAAPASAYASPTTPSRPPTAANSPSTATSRPCSPPLAPPLLRALGCLDEHGRVRVSLRLERQVGGHGRRSRKRRRPGMPKHCKTLRRGGASVLGVQGYSVSAAAARAPLERHTVCPRAALAGQPGGPNQLPNRLPNR